MKKKTVEKLEVKKPRRYQEEGNTITVQYVSNILVLNVFDSYKYLKGRHCFNIDTHEYATLQDGLWRNTYISDVTGVHSMYYWPPVKKLGGFTKKDNEEITKLLDPNNHHYNRYAHQLIQDLEREYGQEKRWNAELRRAMRLEALMNCVPEVTNEMREWIFKQSYELERFMKDDSTGFWNCSKCGETFEEFSFESKPKRHKLLHCPSCGTLGKVEVRKAGRVNIDTTMSVIQGFTDPEGIHRAVIRHFDVEFHFTPYAKKDIKLSEATRVITGTQNTKYGGYDIYYNHCPKRTRGYYGYYAGPHDCISEQCAWDKGNPANRKMKEEYLYPDGIEALEGTAFEHWIRSLKYMSMQHIKIDYNSLMAVSKKALAGVTELLIKGRFKEILREQPSHCYSWDGRYSGPLNLEGQNIQEVFGINDKQLINRLRDKNGGETMLRWLKYSDKTGIKFSDRALKWFSDHTDRVTNDGITKLLDYMSPEASMNYITRQQAESYPTQGIARVIEQYADYMAMCEAIGKDTSDEMVYRPRELKRRHDELITEKQQLDIVRRMNENPEKRKEEADKMRQKFPGAEEILREITPKFAWEDENYIILVPQNLVEIMIEGNALHHCVGSSDRYFDRIIQRETYICFLREKQKPNIPYYTIEVEPGGTIRQHRGAFDEEPNIELVKPALRNWQRHIKKQMSKKDKEWAKISQIKREENIKQLKASNNTRVLDGLREDFMEAI